MRTTPESRSMSRRLNHLNVEAGGEKAGRKGRVYTCTVCKREAFWGPSWGYYGSLAHEEICPQDLIFVCSDKCLAVAGRNVASGAWELPKVSLRGYVGKVTLARRGY